ncbi:PKD-like family lipoprotein [Flavisolibacter tropicus]|uniref:Bacteroidetes PKD-like domain-containing protein n=1 Tax=Flavisolibacter tropicus TaxID=1492898 RepID=A0A172U1Z0_9BACT|nr:PKD-like family lipoprotein [Flavisolibacter tropicus]ANE53198.1 hypothetical protein SY85_24775 [Flavisolibacter tropicus]
MNKLKHILVLLLSSCLLLMACMKDEGNYNYQNSSSYFVDTTSVPRTIVIKQNDVVTITPANTTAANGLNLSYEWKLVQASFAADPATGTYFEKKIGTEKNLTYKVTETPADYILILYVTDKGHGNITQMIKVPFNVSSYASQGWMVLHGGAAGSDISIVVNSKMNTLLPASTDYVQANVFSETNGKKIEGEGAALNYVGQHWVDVYTKTNMGGYRASGNDLRILNTYSDMFISPMQASDIQFQGYGLWSYNQLLVNKGDLYFIPQPTPNTYNKFGVKCFGEDYVASPYIATIMLGSYYGVIYDTKNKRFLYIDFQRTVKPFKAPGATAAFNMTNVGKEMVYAEHGFDSRWFCVMQNDAAPSSRELFVCKFNVADDGNRAVARYNISAATELANAKYFAFGNRGNIMYYATDTKIYQNDYAGSLASTERLNLATNYPGYVITSMKVFKVTNHANDGKILYVALYNPSNQQGVVLQIDIDEVSGVFKTTKAYTGFGQVYGMNYKAK